MERCRPRRPLCSTGGAPLRRSEDAHRRVARASANGNTPRMASNFDIAHLREEYGQRGLLEGELDPDPLRQFQKWLTEAIAQQLLEPNAMTLATVDATGQPWSRTVLLKGCDSRGFSFFTNYESAKGRQLAHETRCALTFRWGELERQVNVTGRVEKVPRARRRLIFRSVRSRAGSARGLRGRATCSRIARLWRKISRRQRRASARIRPRRSTGAATLCARRRSNFGKAAAAACTTACATRVSPTVRGKSSVSRRRVCG